MQGWNSSLDPGSDLLPLVHALSYVLLVVNFCADSGVEAMWLLFFCSGLIADIAGYDLS
jgi:hypothetical protein